MQLTEAQTELRVWKQTQPGEGRQAGWQDNNQLLQKIADLQVLPLACSNKLVASYNQSSADRLL